MSTTLTLNQPCRENWDRMIPAPDGRFCRSCEKMVYDFSDKSPAEIRAILVRNQGNVCARVPSEQFSFESTGTRFRWSWAALGLIAFLGLKQPAQATEKASPALEVVDSGKAGEAKNKRKIRRLTRKVEKRPSRYHSITRNEEGEITFAVKSKRHHRFRLLPRFRKRSYMLGAYAYD